MAPHLSTTFKIENYSQKGPKFKAVYSRNNLPKKKGWGVSNKSQ